MFFENIPITIMDPSIKELEEECGIETTIPTSPSEEWATYAYLTGKNKGLNDMYCVNFGYYISTFLGGMGVDAGTDIYFKLELDDYMFNKYEEIQSKPLTDEEKVKLFFNTLLDLYESGEISKYEKSVFNHHFRVPSNVKEWFTNQNKSVKKTINNLINGNVDSPHLWDNNSSANISFRLTYTEETKWINITGDNDVEKLRKLLE